MFGGGNDRAVLAFLRALYACGQRASIVARTADDRVLRTRYRDEVKCVREHDTLTLLVFADCIQRVRRSVGQRTLVVLPSTEYFNEFLLQNREAIEQMGCEIPLVDSTVYGLLTGKRTATDYFAANGFAVPKEHDVAAVMELPVVAKPLHNVAADGRSLYPQIIATREQLDAFRAREKGNDHFFQEYVHGDSVYLLFYLPRGRLGAEIKWSQRNLLQQPAGKSMLFAEAADFHCTATAENMIALLRETGFWGLGMIEVIRTPGGHATFIEMNPRIWGPIQFCLDQHQPLLQAFIGDALYGDASRYLEKKWPNRWRKRYCWLGGFAETLVSGETPTRHPGMRSTVAFVGASFLDDIYLRSDSWRCFFYDVGKSIGKGRRS